MKTVIQVHTTEDVIATINRINELKLNSTLIDFDKLVNPSWIVNDGEEAIEQLLNMDWGVAPDFHNDYVQIVERSFMRERTLLMLVLTSSNNKTILRVDYEEGENPVDGYSYIGFKGTRGRFINDLEDYCNITASVITESDIGITLEKPSICETTGPEDMMPWESMSSYLIRHYENGNKKPLMDAVKCIYQRGISCYSAEPEMNVSEKVIVDYLRCHNADRSYMLDKLVELRQREAELIWSL